MEGRNKKVSAESKSNILMYYGVVFENGVKRGHRRAKKYSRRFRENRCLILHSRQNRIKSSVDLKNHLKSAAIDEKITSSLLRKNCVTCIELLYIKSAKNVFCASKQVNWSWKYPKESPTFPALGSTEDVSACQWSCISRKQGRREKIQALRWKLCGKRRPE